MSGGVKKLGDSAKGLAKNPLDPKRYADVGLRTVTAGQVGVDDASRLLLGKKNKGVKDSYAPLDPIQVKALGKFNKMLDINSDQEAKNQITANERQIMAGAADAERFAKDTVAQRGLGGSAAGLSSIINTRRNLGRDISANRAMLPGLKNQLSTQNLLNATQGIQSIFNNRIFKQGTPGGGRQGGLLPLLTAGIGGMMGGAGGAQAGLGIGQAINQTV
jgi:hypothetical protein